ncbi:glycosyltransferase, partial [Pseudomonas sp. FW305-E2]|uniref:glycosyltransferase n=1 Tax=Pseudomonas sp. FW305-E2 TaxID=2075558 RepID=UPI0013048463
MNNGSSDGSEQALATNVAKLENARVLHLKKNIGYGGGVFAGLQQAKYEFLAFIPGDLQVAVEDFIRVWSSYK